MNSQFEKINRILTEWNPIEVDKTIAISEYKGYVPAILKSANNKDVLIKCLTDILVNDIGLNYDFSNESHVKDLQQVCKKIMQALQ